jgi:hypothetical protein
VNHASLVTRRGHVRLIAAMVDAVALSCTALLCGRFSPVNRLSRGFQAFARAV